MIFFEGRIAYEPAEEDKTKTYFLDGNDQKHLLIIIGKGPEETTREFAEIRKIPRGSKLRVEGETAYYKAEDREALFCHSFRLLE